MATKQRQLKCSRCGELFDRELLTTRSGKKYCEQCLIERQEEIEANRSDWDRLFSCICEIYDIAVPTGMMFQQLKTYRDEYKYTDIGMYYTLKYYYDILENEVLEGSGLGIIPYFYDKAKKHYNKVYDIKDIVNNFENNEKIVNIKTKIYEKSLPKKEPISLNWEECYENNQNTNK